MRPMHVVPVQVVSDVGSRHAHAGQGGGGNTGGTTQVATASPEGGGTGGTTQVATSPSSGGANTDGAANTVAGTGQGAGGPGDGAGPGQGAGQGQGGGENTGGIGQNSSQIASAGASKAADAGAQTTFTRDGISVSLVREPSAQTTGVINVFVPKEMATSGAGFSFPLPAQVAAETEGSNIRVTTLDGNNLPNWLKYLPDTKTFVSTAVPDGAFPFSVLVTVGSQRTTVAISASSAQ